jgi:3'(2'), 5'-bisphosphate nucleotidase
MIPVSRVVSIAREAGDAIMEVYGRDDHGTTHKIDESPLTLADRAAHDRIVARLSEEGDVPVLSEESESVPYEERARWTSFWLVDPLDGTKEFIKRNGEFTVNIALVRDRRPVLGVVHAPALGTTYWAAEGEGAYKRDADGAERRIAVSDYRQSGLQVVASRSHAGELMPRFLAALGDPECVSSGSSLKFCLVAEGAANLYPRFGPTMEWDIAAAHSVVLEAGGTITDVDGRELEFDKPDLHNPWFVVCGRPPYPWRPVLAALEPEPSTAT